MLKASMGSLGLNEVNLEAVIRNLGNKASFPIKQIKIKSNNSSYVLEGHKKKDSQFSIT
jgi:hypothetical protein